jgi:hypothetical protein
MDTVPKITREVLEGYLHCKTKGLLILAGERGTKPEYEVWRQTLAARQRTSAAAAITARYQGRLVAEDIALTVPNIKSKPDAILNGNFENEAISLSLDALIKAEPSGSQSQSNYIPTLFHDGEIRPLQRALIGFFCGTFVRASGGRTHYRARFP